MTELDARALADFCHDLRLDAAPQPVQDIARTLLVDTLGCLVGGLRYQEVQALGERLDLGGPASSTEVPFGRLVTWGSAATWLDADSGGSFHPQGHRLPPVPTAHPAPHILPVLLHHALTGEHDDAELLRMFLAAMEVGLRFGVGTTLRPGFHPHGIHGPVAAAVAHARLSGLDRETTAEAILLGLSQPLTATLTVPMRGGTVRNVWTGLGTFLGAQAASRAASGTRGDRDTVRELFDSAVCTDWDLSEIQDGLGERWRVVDSYLKPYACARWIHPAVDAFAEAAVAAGREPGPGLHHQLDRIEVRTFAFAASLNARRPESDMHARFSLPTCLAAFAVHGGLFADTFLPDQLAHPGVAATATLVSISEDDHFTAALPAERPTSVAVTWRDGTTSSVTVRNARGNPDNPLPVDEIERKFRANVGALVDADGPFTLLPGYGGADRVHTHHLAAVAGATAGGTA